MPSRSKSVAALLVMALVAAPFLALIGGGCRPKRDSSDALPPADWAKEVASRARKGKYAEARKKLPSDVAKTESKPGEPDRPKGTWERYYRLKLMEAALYMMEGRAARTDDLETARNNLDRLIKKLKSQMENKGDDGLDKQQQAWAKEMIQQAEVLAQVCQWLRTGSPRPGDAKDRTGVLLDVTEKMYGMKKDELDSIKELQKQLSKIIPMEGDAEETVPPKTPPREQAKRWGNEPEGLVAYALHAYLGELLVLVDNCAKGPPKGPQTTAELDELRRVLRYEMPKGLADLLGERVRLSRCFRLWKEETRNEKKRRELEDAIEKAGKLGIDKTWFVWAVSEWDLASSQGAWFGDPCSDEKRVALKVAIEKAKMIASTEKLKDEQRAAIDTKRPDGLLELYDVDREELESWAPKKEQFRVTDETYSVYRKVVKSGDTLAERYLRAVLHRYARPYSRFADDRKKARTLLAKFCERVEDEMAAGTADPSHAELLLVAQSHRLTLELESFGLSRDSAERFGECHRRGRELYEATPDGSKLKSPRDRLRKALTEKALEAVLEKLEPLPTAEKLRIAADTETYRVSLPKEMYQEIIDAVTWDETCLGDEDLIDKCKLLIKREELAADRERNLARLSLFRTVVGPRKFDEPQRSRVLGDLLKKAGAESPLADEKHRNLARLCLLNVCVEGGDWKRASDTLLNHWQSVSEHPKPLPLQAHVNRLKLARQTFLPVVNGLMKLGPKDAESMQLAARLVDLELPPDIRKTLAKRGVRKVLAEAEMEKAHKAVAAGNFEDMKAFAANAARMWEAYEPTPDDQHRWAGHYGRLAAKLPDDNPSKVAYEEKAFELGIADLKRIEKPAELQNLAVRGFRLGKWSKCAETIGRIREKFSLLTSDQTALRAAAVVYANWPAKLAAPADIDSIRDKTGLRRGTALRRDMLLGVEAMSHKEWPRADKALAAACGGDASSPSAGPVYAALLPHEREVLRQLHGWALFERASAARSEGERKGFMARAADLLLPGTEEEELKDQPSLLRDKTAEALYHNRTRRDQPFAAQAAKLYAAIVADEDKPSLENRRRYLECEYARQPPPREEWAEWLKTTADGISWDSVRPPRADAADLLLDPNKSKLQQTDKAKDAANYYGRMSYQTALKLLGQGEGFGTRWGDRSNYETKPYGPWILLWHTVIYDEEKEVGDQWPGPLQEWVRKGKPDGVEVFAGRVAVWQGAAGSWPNLARDRAAEAYLFAALTAENEETRSVFLLRAAKTFAYGNPEYSLAVHLLSDGK